MLQVAMTAVAHNYGYKSWVKSRQEGWGNRTEMMENRRVATLRFKSFGFVADDDQAPVSCGLGRLVEGIKYGVET